MYEDLEQLCELLSEELHEATEKVRSGMSGSDLEYVDKLTHALKSVTILKEMQNGNSYEAYDSYDGNSNRRRSYDNSMRSYRRRDSRGRYSRDEDVVAGLKELAENAPDQQTRAEIHKFIRTMGG